MISTIDKAWLTMLLTLLAQMLAPVVTGVDADGTFYGLAAPTIAQVVISIGAAFGVWAMPNKPSV